MMEERKPIAHGRMTYGIDGISKIPEPIITDPMGSYTGRPTDKDEKPVQDADDL